MAGPLRARDLRANIAELGFEKGVVMTLELMLDEYVGIRDAVKEITDMQSQIIAHMEVVSKINEGVVKRLVDIKRREEQFDEHRGSGIVPHGDGG